MHAIAIIILSVFMCLPGITVEK